MTNPENIEEHYPLVLSIVRNFYVPKGLERDDLIQAGLIGIWKATQTYNENKSTFGTYAYTIARNEILMVLRKHAKFEQEIPSTIHEEIVEVEGFENEVIYNQMKKELAEEEKQIVELLYLGYTQREIARELGTTQPSICQRIRKLRVRGKRKWGSLYE